MEGGDRNLLHFYEGGKVGLQKGKVGQGYRKAVLKETTGTKKGTI
jgi:hypothetical protein